MKDIVKFLVAFVVTYFVIMFLFLETHIGQFLIDFLGHL